MSKNELETVLNQPIIDVKELYQQWGVSTPWRSTGRFEPLQIFAGKLLYRQTLYNESRFYGFKLHHHQIDGFQVHWLSNKKNKKSKGSILLIHGLSADKSHWVRFARYLAKDYHVIIPDLPAHGQTGYLSNADYSVERQARRMIELLDHLGINQVHVLGNSMGGFISIFMAHKWSHRIASLGLLNSAGLKPRTHSVLEAAFHGAKNPFIVNSVSEFNELLSLAASKQQWMPYSVRLMLAKQLADRRERLFKLSLQVMQEITEFNCAEKSKDAFKMSTLVIWGEEDKLLDVDMLEHFVEIIPHAHSVKLPNTGHMPMLECPKIAAKHYKRFINTL